MAQTSPQHTAPANADQHDWVQTDSKLDHVHALARQLVRHLGESGARKTCRDNHWNGVLNVIDAMH